MAIELSRASFAGVTSPVGRAATGWLCLSATAGADQRCGHPTGGRSGEWVKILTWSQEQYPLPQGGSISAISFLVYYSLSWTVETLNETVEAEVAVLPEDMRARLARIVLLIEEKGLERVGEPHVKHLEGRLWEMRMKGRSGISRALYVTVVAQRVVILRVFIKKTERTPRREVDLALSRAKLIKETEK